MIIDAVVATGGTGLWSDFKKDVRIKSIDVDVYDVEDSFGEMRVYFDTATWNLDTDGLIYTDPQFKENLKLLLLTREFPADDWFGYSEQGMQGEDFVSFDVGGPLLLALAQFK